MLRQLLGIPSLAACALAATSVLPSVFLSKSAVADDTLVAAPADVAADPATLSLQKGREGLAAYDAGSWDLALTRFREADALYHSPVFVLYSARCLDSLGRLLEARNTYRRVLDEKLDEEAPEPWRQAQWQAWTELAALQLSIPSVVIVVEGASSSTRLTVDEAPAEPGQRIWLDPGEHSALAVDGERQVSRAFSLRRGERNAETALVLPVPPAAPVTPERKSVLPGVLLGLGGTSLLVGSTLGVWAVARRPDGRLRLPSVCQQRETTECPESEREAVSDELARAESARKAIRTEGTAGAVLLAGGLTLATTGIALAWARSHSARRGPALALHAKLLCAEVRIDF